MAVGEAKGHSLIYRQANNGGNSVIGVVQPDQPSDYDQMARNSEPVTISTLDDELWSEPPPRILVMKMDIQGFEVKALHGARRLLAARAIQHIQLEADPAFLRAQNTSTAELCGLLIDAGFTLSANPCPVDSASEIYATLGSLISVDTAHAAAAAAIADATIPNPGSPIFNETDAAAIADATIPNPTTTTLKAAIIYLIELDDQQALRSSLTSLRNHFRAAQSYMVLLFYDPHERHLLTPEIRSEILQIAPVQFHEATTFHDHPAHVDPERTAGNADSFTTGYRRMCRFWAYGVFQEPVMQTLDYYWRLDSDLDIQQDILHDPFQQAQTAGLQYVYGVMRNDAQFVLTGLWDLTMAYMRKRSLHPRSMLPLVADGLNYEQVSSMPLDEAIDAMTRAGYNALIYYNNFELSVPALWRSQAYLDYFAEVDNAGGIFFYRWGDAPIRTLAVHMLLPPSQVAQWKPSLMYQHQGQWTT